MNSPKGGSERGRLWRRRAYIKFGGTFAVLLTVALYSNLREPLGAPENQWIDAAFAAFLLISIYALVLAAKPSRLAVTLVTAAVGILCTYVWLMIVLFYDPMQSLKSLTFRPYGFAVTVIICAILWYAGRRWDG